ncbi:sensor histidine kinase, partial [Dietzia sp. DQ12-76]|uniref:sensor histidine kinase n=1 Tax=Dietzia sp. DQ12-76 TaxID=1630639 RepID=UPI0015FCC7ED
LGNLLDNALRHAPESAVRLTARTLWDAGRARTLIAVADDGEGIAAPSRDAVLHSFHREGDTNASSGIGLGLSVVRGFVEAMGGTVSIDETPGGGTTVEVDLPACRDSEREGASEGESG